MNILHITPHTGGGVGTVILNWILKDNLNQHCLMLLGYADIKTVKICNENNIKCYEKVDKDIPFLYSEMNVADIIIVHYWNHPLLLNFLVDRLLPSCRLVTWFHNSGFNDPYSLPENIIEMSNRMVFTSPISYDLPICKYLLPKFKSQLRDIWSTGGVEKYKSVKHKEHDGFNILYVGTLDFAKIREDFIFICLQILKEIPEATITICGNGSSMQEMVEQVNDLDLQDKIKFEGLVSDLIPYFEISDCFLYLLDSKSFSTCEQVLGESMASGLIPIVFDNACEKEIITNELNGFVVSTIKECVDRIKELYEDKEDGIFWSQLSLNAKLTAQEKYSIDKMIDKWNNLFEEVILEEKKEKEWSTNFTNIYGIGTVAFLESLDYDNAKLFHEYVSYERKIEQLFRSNLQWHSESKGSIKQYLKYFPNDKYLNKFQRIMDEDIL
jgi:glycosyltransferase involved in cell wall biosynthesis